MNETLTFKQILGIRQRIGENLFNYAKCRYTTDKEKETYGKHCSWYVEFEDDFFTDPKARQEFFDNIIEDENYEPSDPNGTRISVNPLIYLLY